MMMAALGTSPVTPETTAAASRTSARGSANRRAIATSGPVDFTGPSMLRPYRRKAASACTCVRPSSPTPRAEARACGVRVQNAFGSPVCDAGAIRPP